MGNELSGPPIPSHTAHVQEIIKKGGEIYAKLEPLLEPKHDGEYIAIEVESGEYFIGDTREDAMAKVEEKFPTKTPFCKKIGKPEHVARTYD